MVLPFFVAAGLRRTGVPEGQTTPAYLLRTSDRTTDITSGF